MKTQFRFHRERAVALIIVLAMLVLLSGLVVSFMTAVGNERAATVISNNEVTSRQIADSTVNLVISQIREATSETGGGVAIPTTWASQPGAIRTFSGKVTGIKNVTNGASGVRQPTYRAGGNDSIFKLFSAEKMKVGVTEFSGNQWDKKEVDVIDNWRWSMSESEREDTFKIFGYVDLNEPIVTPMPAELTKGDPQIVEPRYPIVDPRAKYDQAENANLTPEPGIVEGFDIKTSGLLDDKLKFLPKDALGKRGASAPSKVPYLPMPVKWLYVMRDGSMAAAEDSSGGKIPGASADNPIIGRTAFWTDDDCTRLNINTASEGTFWDTPTASSEQESGNVDASGRINASVGSLNLSAAQPARGEYQRYPGHPATTSLSPAIGWMWGNFPKDWPRVTLDRKLIEMKDAIAQLTPFSPYGYRGPKQTLLPTPPNPAPPQSTSMGASYNAAYDSVSLDPNVKKTETEPKLAIATKHLYSTVDELVFKQERVPANTSEATTLNSPNIVPESLEKVRFFLTVNSRSPELNLFGRPRVTFWPVHADPTQRTAYDDLFAFTSTFYKDPIGNGAQDNTFFFTRSNAKSATIDFNPKNVTIMTYLKTLTSSAFQIPGFGGSFEEKYSKEETEQILTLVFDYCRCVNLVDTSRRIRLGEEFRPYTPFYYDPNLDAKAYNTYAPRSVDWSGQVTPLRTNPTSRFQGLGRFPMISEAAIVFHRANPATKIQATLLFEMSTVMAGFPVLRDTYWMRVTVNRPTKIGTTDIELVGLVGDKRINIVNVGSHDVGFGRSYLPILGFMNQLHFFSEPKNPTLDKVTTYLAGQAAGKKFEKHVSTVDGAYVNGTTVQYYPFVSNAIDIPTGPELTYSCGSYTVDIFAAERPGDTNPGRGDLVQTFVIDFPKDVTFKAKIPGVAGTIGSFTNRLNGQEGTWTIFNGTEDVIRTMEYVGAKAKGAGWETLTGDQRGDLRLGAAQRVVPAEAFAPRGELAKYTSTSPRIHGLQVGHADPYLDFAVSGNAGLLAAGGVNRGSKPPTIPAGINGVKRSDGGPGDWDRGLSKHTDGAMANKVDEGNVFFNIADNDVGGKVPYFRGRAIEETGKSFFSPNRQMSSAVMFGSLPTGVVRGLPWQTLLFRPDRGTIRHPGAQQVGQPADHLILDLFNLPIVEPYAISEPFSSGGKVNLNYVIAPFGYAKGDSDKRRGNSMGRSYIRRDTALRGVLKAVKIMAVPTKQADAGHTEAPVSQTVPFRFDIDAEKTLDQFEDRLKDPDRGLFRSATEICDMDLYPFRTVNPATPGALGLQAALTPVSPVSASTPLSDWGSFWDTHYAQTGDNMRERPYSHIYPRVTTKSNVYTIYMRCQAVKKVAGTPPDKFDPKKDKVIGAYRGSATIERFIDPNDKELRDYKPTDPNSSVEKFYRFRVLNTKQFLPR